MSKPKISTFIGYEDEIIEKNIGQSLKDVEARYQHKVGKTVVDIIYTKTHAMWFAKKKGKFYGNVISLDKKRFKKFDLIDAFFALKTNAEESLASV
jgi:hypothetical protein